MSKGHGHPLRELIEAACRRRARRLDNLLAVIPGGSSMLVAGAPIKPTVS
jgi:hypothetical protein